MLVVNLVHDDGNFNLNYTIDSILQHWSLLNWRKIRYRCGSVAVPVNWKNKRNRTATDTQRFKVFAIFKNVAHSLEPGETPSYSASHQAPNYVQLSLNRFIRIVLLTIVSCFFWHIQKVFTYMWQFRPLSTDFVRLWPLMTSLNGKYRWTGQWDLQTLIYRWPVQRYFPLSDVIKGHILTKSVDNGRNCQWKLFG